MFMSKVSFIILAFGFNLLPCAQTNPALIFFIFSFLLKAVYRMSAIEYYHSDGNKSEELLDSQDSGYGVG